MPYLEIEMLNEMMKYFESDIVNLSTYINKLILVRKEYKKIKRLVEVKELTDAINQLTGKKNQASNLLAFVKRYLEELRE